MITPPDSGRIQKLHAAAVHGNTDYIADFIKQHGTAIIDARMGKSDLEKSGATALLRAINAGQTITAMMLLEAGASPYAESAKGYTPLQQAIWHCEENVIEYMLKTGLDANYTGLGHGYTPLFLAADMQQTGMMKLLLAHGADIDAFDKNGGTTLMMSVKEGRWAIVRFLLDHGASLLPVNKNGQTASDIARMQGDDRILQIIDDVRRQRADRMAESIALKKKTPVFPRPCRLKPRSPR